MQFDFNWMYTNEKIYVYLQLVEYIDVGICTLML